MGHRELLPAAAAARLLVLPLPALKHLAMLGVIDEEVGRAGEREQKVAQVRHASDPFRPNDAVGVIVLEKKSLREN